MPKCGRSCRFLGDKYFEDFGDIFVTLGDQDTTEICTEILQRSLLMRRKLGKIDLVRPSLGGIKGRTQI